MRLEKVPPQTRGGEGGGLQRMQWQWIETGNVTAEGWPLRSQSMTVPSQLSLGTKQKAHQEQHGEEEAGGGRHSCSVARPLDEVSGPAARGRRSGGVQSCPCCSLF
ncbi:hypothetical protein CgunFtcFv8_011017 [Champsocephalus gunnari]|uniref:Uncharacterized protein n=1 Tax=Champsocephalus gunnari TaxID=52237 RepID=A0AAN8DUY6_CHAGU|nr:hypothetical protein CgunFtcFv8_011017 [Champsocephalus gunnari]